MVYLYTGTPGSGKTYHIAKLIQEKLQNGFGVVTNVKVDLDRISKGGKKKIGEYVYIPIDKFNVKTLKKFAYKHHKKGKEGQSWLIMDECQVIFNPRDYAKYNRAEWVIFFSHHRHYGFNVILSTQWDRLIDRQIRSQVEYETKHRCANNLGLLFLMPIKIFITIQVWYGAKVTNSKGFMIFSKKIGRLYDSYVLYEDFRKEMQAEFGEMIDDETQAPDAASAEVGVGGSPRRRRPRKRSRGWSENLRTAPLRA